MPTSSVEKTLRHKEVAALDIMAMRTALEDKTLHAELEGYAEFAERTRYRLLPGIW